MYRLTDQVFVYGKCVDCKLIQLTVRPRAEDVELLYPSHYEPYMKHASASRAKAARRDRLVGVFTALLTKRTLALAHRVPLPEVPGERALDFGCGSSEPLDRLRQLGWSAFGADFSPTVVAQVRQAGYDAVMADDIDSAIPDETLGLIQMNHVLEHVYDLEATVALVASKLRAGGVLQIALPNPNGISSHIFRDHWMALEPRHITLPSPSVVTQLLRPFFSEIEVIQEPVGKDLARSWHYSRAARAGSTTTDVNAILADSKAVALSSVIGAIAGWAGAADRFRVLAWK